MSNEIPPSLPLDLRLKIIQSRDHALESQLQGLDCERGVYQRAAAENRSLTFQDQIEITQCKDRALEGQLSNIEEETFIYNEEARKIEDALKRNKENTFKMYM